MQVKARSEAATEQNLRKEVKSLSIIRFQVVKYGIEIHIYRKFYIVLSTGLVMGKPQIEIVDRNEEVEKLVSGLSDPSRHVNYALIGPLRIGKTTILLKVKGELEKRRVIVVYVDLSVYRFSPYDFAQN